MEATPTGSQQLCFEIRKETIQAKIKDITEGNQAEELRVRIPLWEQSSSSCSVMVYKPQIRDSSKKNVTILKQVDQSKLDTPVPEDEQLARFFYCDICSKKFRNRAYLQTHMQWWCQDLKMQK